jgi:hypothetical protein
MRYEDLPLVGQGGVLQLYRWYSTVGPHTLTTRLNIASGTDEILVVRRVCLWARRSTQPTTWGIAYIACYLAYGTDRHDIVLLPLMQNEFPVYRSYSEQLNFPLVSGTSIKADTYDSSTGGTVEYSANIFVERFYI